MDVADAEDVVVDVAVGVGVVVGGAVDVVDVAAAEDVGRKDTYLDSSVDCQRKRAVLACKTGQGRRNNQRQKQIAIESAGVIENVSVRASEVVTGEKEDGRGRNGPERGGLACLLDEWMVAVRWRKKSGQVRARESQRC